MNVFVLQNPGMIAGMMQKVNPFKSSQLKAADTQSVHSEFSSSTGSLADDNNHPEKQVDPCSETTLPHLNQLFCFNKLHKECLPREIMIKRQEMFEPDLRSTEKQKTNTHLPLLFLLLPVDGAGEGRVEVRFVISSRKMFKL